MLVLRIIIFLVCICGSIKLFSNFHNFNKYFENDRKIFVSYLEKNNDYETLYKIGEINRKKEKKRHYPNYLSIVSFLKKNSTKSIEYDNHLKLMQKYKNMFLLNLFPAFVLLMISLFVLFSF